MSTRFAVVDTNVVVSGLLTRDAHSPTGQILDAMLRGAFRFLLSADLLAEYRAVLLRAKIPAIHGLSPEQIDRLLAAIAANATIREPESIAPPNPYRGTSTCGASGLSTPTPRWSPETAPSLTPRHAEPQSYLRGAS